MTSTAFSSQGTTFQIGTGTGGAKTISGTVGVGFPTVLTVTTHGFNNGDVVVLAGLTGADAATLNGQTVAVQFKTTSTFAVAVDTTGLSITASGTATPNTYTTINNVKTFSAFDGKAAVIDITNLSSTAKEKLMGLQDFGKFTFDIDIDQNDAGQAALIAAKASRAIKLFKLNLSNSKVASFSGFVMSYPNTGGVDKVVSGSVEVEISGVVTIA